MSALADRVLGEHVPKIESTRRGSVTNHKRLCSCGEPLPWQDWQPLHQVHLAEAFEAAVRAQIAADIENLEHTREDRQNNVSIGLYSVDWHEGFDHAVSIAARIA